MGDGTSPENENTPPRALNGSGGANEIAVGAKKYIIMARMRKRFVGK